MSKTFLTPDLGIIAPKTVAPAAGKSGADQSFKADAFEGALSSAVARQRDEDAKAQRAKSSQEPRKHLESSGAGQSEDGGQGSADAAAASRDGAAKALPRKIASQKATKAPVSGRDDVADATSKAAANQSADAVDEEVFAADSSSDPVQAVAADGSGGESNADASDDQPVADTNADAPKTIDSVEAVVVAPIPAAVAPSGDADLTSDATSSVAASAPANTPAPAPAPSDLDPESANPGPAQSVPASAASASQTDGDAASGDLQAQTRAAAEPTASGPQNAAPTSPQPSPTAQTSAQATPTQKSSPQADSSRTAAEVVPQAPASHAPAAQAASQPTAESASPQAASAPAAAKPFIPAESSSVASLKNAIDIPTTVTYAANTATSSQGSAAGLGNSNGGAGFGGNANNQAAVPARAAGSAAIVAQDVAQTDQQTAFQEVLAAPEAATAEATSADDLPVVEAKPSSAQPTTNAQTLANRLAFDAPGAQQGAPAARAHHVLLPLANQVTAGLAKLAQSGGGEINIHLQPANLGRVDVSMKIAEDGRMTATITADRQDTLDLLRRDSYALERSLAEAGLKTDDAGLQFSLRGEGGQRDRDSADSRGGRPLALVADPEPIQASPTRRASSLSRLDMRI